MKKKSRSHATMITSKSTVQIPEEVYVPPLDVLYVKVLCLKLTEDVPKHYAIKITFYDQLLLNGIIKSMGARQRQALNTFLAKGSMNYDPSDFEKMCLMADCPLIGQSFARLAGKLIRDSSMVCVTGDEFSVAGKKSAGGGSGGAAGSRRRRVQPRSRQLAPCVQRTARCPPPPSPADHVHIQPLKSVETNLTGSQPFSLSGSSKSFTSDKSLTDISCCNVDVLPLFIDTEIMTVEKRMEPMVTPSLLHRRSWDNLPLLAMEISVLRDKRNSCHHQILKEANYMKLTLVATYNMRIPNDEEFIFMAASKTPLHNETNTGLVTFNQGQKASSRFDELSFYPKWESLRVGDDVFTKGDEKFVCEQESIQNEDNLDLKYYMSDYQRENMIVWGSFHRSLLLPRSKAWLSMQFRRFSWPFEVHIYGDQGGGHSFMAFLDLFRLLYPGEHTVRLAVPLQWVNGDVMLDKCNCELLLTPAMPTSNVSTPKPTLSATNSSSSDTYGTVQPTGADENSAFIIVEVKLARPLKKAVMPTMVTSSEIHAMVKEMEQGLNKRECTGRGQLDKDWQSTVRSAEISLHKVPHYGMTEFCTFNRQLSETRTRVELMTSCWLDAAVYVNNNFVVQEFLESADIYEEMLMMSHACLMRVAGNTLLGGDNRQDINPTLRAARHARQMQDISHAIELHLQIVLHYPRGPDGWRELSTCLLDVDRDWANVCINRAVMLDPRHPLSLLSKASMLFDEDPEAAEPFFEAILAFFPFWSTGWVIANAYYTKRQQFYMADQVMEYMRKSEADGYMEDTGVCAWGHELGDWWDPTPLLPGMSPYYAAADLLLRLRAVSLAEVCLARAVSGSGETAAAFHLVALCCRLRGNVDEALCHAQLGIDKFGDINYLRGLQAECLHKKKDITAAMASYEKSGSCLSAYSILLSMPSWEPQRARLILLDLIRRQPSAYAWVALAEDWMQRSTAGESGDDATIMEEQTGAKVCAIASAVQALKCDRQAGRAWALLSQLVAPSARRQHCRKMANLCGYTFSDETHESVRASQQSLCHRLGRPLRECRCALCKKTSS